MDNIHNRPPIIAIASPYEGGASDAYYEKPVSPSKKKSKGYSNTSSSSSMGSYNVTVNEEGARTFLKKHNWSEGLVTAFIKSCYRIPIRFIICDDSGSMLTNDGHRLVGSGAGTKLIKCSRWSELVESLHFHCNLAEAASAPTEFRLLNNAEPVLVGCGDNGKGLSVALDIFNNESPGGNTPLCAQIHEVIEKIREIEDSLRENSQRACVVIATDGESTDGDIAEAMSPLQGLPVWVVIRLCTDEEKIVNYWNNVDENLELEMDVLDDLAGEAQEIRNVNPWLAYSEPIHRLREFGAVIKEMDLLDESLLSSEQMRVVVSTLISNGNYKEFTHPDEDWNAFITKTASSLPASLKVFDVLDKKVVPQINVAKLAAKYNTTGASSTACSVM